MSNLTNSIRRFKAKRQAAKQTAPEQDEIDRLVKIYEAIGPGECTLKQDFAKQWDKLPEEKRAELVSRLLKAGLLPEQIGYALEIFQGKVVNLI